MSSRPFISLLPLALIIVSATLTSSAQATPATSIAPNGCPPDLAGAEYRCPASSEKNHAYIDYLYSDRETDAIGVRLTDDGLKAALTCEGAAEIAEMVIRLYDEVPRDERARDEIDWATQQMINEIHAHGHLSLIPRFHVEANPIEIDFPQYEGDFSGPTGGATKRGEQALFNSIWGCTSISEDTAK